MCKGTEVEGAGVHVGTGWVRKLRSCVEYESCLVSQMGPEKWASFPVASPAPSLAYLESMHACVHVISLPSVGTKPYHCSRLHHPWSTPALLLSSCMSFIIVFLSQNLPTLLVLWFLLFISLISSGASVLKMTALALPPNWLQVTFTHAGSGLGALCGGLNHPLHASLLHFCHRLLLLHYLSLCSLVSFETLGLKLRFFHFYAPRRQHSAWHIASA